MRHLKIVAALVVFAAGDLATYAQAQTTPDVPCSAIYGVPTPPYIMCTVATPSPTPTAPPTPVPTLPPTPVPTIAPTATPAPTAAPTLAPGPLSFTPSVIAFPNVNASPVAVTISQANSSGVQVFEIDSASTHGIASYFHGLLAGNVLVVAPKGPGTTNIPVIGANAVSGFLAVAVGALPKPSPTALPTPVSSPTAGPTAAPTAQPTAIPTVRPTAAPMTVFPASAAMRVGDVQNFLISQGNFQNGFTASSSSSVISVSVSGRTLTVRALSPGTALITIYGNSGVAYKLNLSTEKV